MDAGLPKKILSAVAVIMLCVIGLYRLARVSYVGEHGFIPSPMGQYIASIRNSSEVLRWPGPDPVTLRQTVSIVLRERSGREVCALEIAVGSGATPGISGISLAWSPCGHRLAYSHRGALYVLTVPSLDKSLVAISVDAFRWLDAQCLIYTTTQGTAVQKEVASGAPGRSRNIRPTSPALTWPPSNPISPDGRQFVCRHGLAVKPVGASDGNLTHAAAGRYEVDACWWSYDSQQCLIQAVDMDALRAGTPDIKRVILYKRKQGTFIPIRTTDIFGETWRVVVMDVVGWSPKDDWFILKGYVRAEIQRSSSRTHPYVYAVVRADLSERMYIEGIEGLGVDDVRISPVHGQLACSVLADGDMQSSRVYIADVQCTQDGMTLGIDSYREVDHGTTWLWCHDGQGILVYTGRGFVKYATGK